MGGSGSRTRSTKVLTAEDLKSIDIRYLKRLGVLGKYRTGILAWTNNGSQTGYIDYSISPSSLDLNYRYRAHGEGWRPIEQIIELVQTECNFGGFRHWFSCPKCNRRCTTLYAGGPLFLCRKCYQIPYRSQTIGPIDRLIHKLHKLNNKLYDESGFRKRKGLHWKTFDRLLEQSEELDERIDNGISEFWNAHLEGVPRGGYSK